MGSTGCGARRCVHLRTLIESVCMKHRAEDVLGSMVVGGALFGPIFFYFSRCLSLISCANETRSHLILISSHLIFISYSETVPAEGLSIPVVGQRGKPVVGLACRNSLQPCPKLPEGTLIRIIILEFIIRIIIPSGNFDPKKSCQIGPVCLAPVFVLVMLKLVLGVKSKNSTRPKKNRLWVTVGTPGWRRSGNNYSNHYSLLRELRRIIIPGIIIPGIYYSGGRIKATENNYSGIIIPGNNYSGQEQ